MFIAFCMVGPPLMAATPIVADDSPFAVHFAGGYINQRTMSTHARIVVLGSIRGVHMDASRFVMAVRYRQAALALMLPR
jgi:hypothetical protein